MPAVGLVALAAVTALGLTYSESDERTVDELARVLHYGGVVALVVSLVDARTWRYAAAGLTSGAVLVSLLALGSRLFPDLFPADAVEQGVPEQPAAVPAQLLERGRGLHGDDRGPGPRAERARPIARWRARSRSPRSRA